MKKMAVTWVYKNEFFSDEKELIMHHNLTKFFFLGNLSHASFYFKKLACDQQRAAGPFSVGLKKLPILF